MRSTPEAWKELGMGDELTPEQKEQIGKLVRRELSPEETAQLKASLTPEQNRQVLFQVIGAAFRIKNPNLVPGIALLIVGVAMLVLFFMMK